MAGLHISPELVLVDGNRCPSLAYPAQAVIKGDARVPAISAASILAKVARDREMQRLDALCEQTPVRIGLSATVSPLPEVARFLRDEPALDFSFCRSITALDLLAEDQLAAIYDLMAVTETSATTPAPTGS